MRKRNTLPVKSQQKFLIDEINDRQELFGRRLFLAD